MLTPTQQAKVDSYVSKAAQYISNERPDLWASQESAREDVSRWAAHVIYNIVSQSDLIRREASTGTGGFLLTASLEIDYINNSFLLELSLSRNIIDISFTSNDDDGDIFDWLD